MDARLVARRARLRPARDGGLPRRPGLADGSHARRAAGPSGRRSRSLDRRAARAARRRHRARPRGRSGAGRADVRARGPAAAVGHRPPDAHLDARAARPAALHRPGLPPWRSSARRVPKGTARPSGAARRAGPLPGDRGARPARRLLQPGVGRLARATGTGWRVDDPARRGQRTVRPPGAVALLLGEARRRCSHRTETSS
jgi:hypothetical protein